MKITSKFLKYNKTCDKNIIFAKNENLTNVAEKSPSARAGMEGNTIF